MFGVLAWLRLQSQLLVPSLDIFQGCCDLQSEDVVRVRNGSGLLVDVEGTVLYRSNLCQQGLPTWYVLLVVARKRTKKKAPYKASTGKQREKVDNVKEWF